MEDSQPQARIAVVTREILAKEKGLIEGTRELLQCLGEIRGMDIVEHYSELVGFNSVTDHLPAGKFRVNWAADALNDKDRDIERLEALWHDRIILIVRELAEEYAIHDPVVDSMSGPIMKADITFLFPENGGRTSLPRGEYRPHVSTKSGEMLGVRMIGLSKDVQFGLESEVTLELVYRGVNYESLISGAKFHILEGSKVVGSGIIKG